MKQTVALNLVTDGLDHHGKSGLFKYLDPVVQHQLFDGLAQSLGVLLGHNNRATESLCPFHQHAAGSYNFIKVTNDGPKSLLDVAAKENCCGGVNRTDCARHFDKI